MEAQPVELSMRSAFSGRDPENNTADDKRMFWKLLECYL